jgi:pimeloyl-ACP methyl ester carboxylesterase
MAEIDRDGVRLGFDDAGQGKPIVLVHGWGGNVLSSSRRLTLYPRITV